MEIQELYMQRALELAAMGVGRVSPNPLVGAVLVVDNHIIGEGYHRQLGGDHAEVSAIKSVEDKKLLTQSTLYVNLEPCSHHGKTPPCTDLILESGIPRVVISNIDPNPLVAGDGIKKLQQAGVEVVTGICEAQGTHLNRRFFTFHNRQRPYIILKWAQTADGFMAREDYQSKWISNSLSRALVHQFRAQEDAIMVGRGTAHYDNPRLTVRNGSGQDPIRVVLDPQLSLAADLNLFDQTVPTICYNFKQDRQQGSITWIKLPKSGFLVEIFNDLYQREIQSVLVEGGSMLLRSLVEGNYWDEARVFVAPKTFTKGINAPSLDTEFIEEKLIGEDRLRIYYPTYNHG